MNKKTLFAILSVMVLFMTNSAKAKSYYYFDSLPGLINNTSSTFPFCVKQDCSYPSSANLDISMAKSKVSIVSGDSISNQVTLNTDVDTSRITWKTSSSDTNTIDNEDIIYNSSSNTISISDEDLPNLSSGDDDLNLKITLTALVDGKIADKASFDLNIFSDNTDMAFVTTWNVSNGDTVSIPTTQQFTCSGYDVGVICDTEGETYTYKYNGTINWGDGTGNLTFTSYNDSNLTHTYTDTSSCSGPDGTCIVTISGDFEALNRNNKGSLPMQSVENLGYVGWKTFYGAFSGSQITSFKVGNADSSNVKSMDGMFNSVNITNLDLTNLDITSLASASAMFGEVSIGNLNLSNWDISNVKNITAMFVGSTISNLILDSWTPNNMDSMFSDANIGNDLDLSTWDFSKVLGFNNAFRGLRVANLNMNNLDLSNVNSISHAFSALVTDKFTANNCNTSNITDFTGLFSGSTIDSLEINNWDLSNSNQANIVFSNTNINSLEANNWNISGTTSLSAFFQKANIGTASLNNWQTSNTTNTTSMFYESNMPNVTLDNWQTSTLTSTLAMIYGSSELTSLDLSSWTSTSNISNFTAMFASTPKLRTVNLGGWDFSNMTEANSMFGGALILDTIIYDESVSKTQYSGFLKTLTLSSLKNNGTIIKGSNLCPSDDAETCASYITNLKGMGWVFKNTSTSPAE